MNNVEKELLSLLLQYKKDLQNKIEFCDKSKIKLQELLKELEDFLKGKE
tara:strand:+ start:5075 stop:5221 length:147 start_codon:yes stop_codon:yes gene_type:complete